MRKTFCSCSGLASKGFQNPLAVQPAAIGNPEGGKLPGACAYPLGNWAAILYVGVTTARDTSNSVPVEMNACLNILALMSLTSVLVQSKMWVDTGDLTGDLKQKARATQGWVQSAILIPPRGLCYLLYTQWDLDFLDSFPKCATNFVTSWLKPLQPDTKLTAASGNPFVSHFSTCKMKIIAQIYLINSLTCINLSEIMRR